MEPYPIVLPDNGAQPRKLWKFNRNHDDKAADKPQYPLFKTILHNNFLIHIINFTNMQLMNVIYYPKRKHETQCFPRFSHPPEPALEAYFMTSNSLQLVSLDQFSNGSPLDDV